MLTSLRSILTTLLPASFVGAGYLVFTGYRHDYLGHYAAGFGATLATLAIACRDLQEKRFLEHISARILLLTLMCIAGGAYAEATVFNIAKFDEVDFCNQSVGAILAGLGFLANLGATKPDAAFFQREFYLGIVALHVGFYFAVF